MYLPTYECRIKHQDVKLSPSHSLATEMPSINSTAAAAAADTSNSTITVPIGECVVALWVWMVTIGFFTLIVWFSIFKTVRLIYKTK